MKKRTITVEKCIAAAIFIFIAVFFFSEMLMKPISGEDVVQQNCMAFSGWNGAGKCADSVLNQIPRIGQVAHYLTIWKFHSIPTIGFETIIRVIDAIMCCGIIYMITLLALGGKRPRLRYKDAFIAAGSFILLILSPFTEMFFKGFSNIHNYVPAVLFTLLFCYFWFWRDPIRKRLGKVVFNTLFVITGFLFAASTELNSLVFFAMLIIYLVWRAVKAKNIKVVFKKWQNYISGIIGVFSGFAFVYIIGNGIGATVNRSDGNYLGSLSISDIFTKPFEAIPGFIANLVNNFYQYLPFLLLGILSVIFYKYIISKTKSKQDNSPQLVAFKSIIFYVIIYIGLCSPVNGVLWRLSVVAFCALLVPIIYLLSESISIVKTKRSIFPIIATGSAIVILTMVIDNISFLSNNLSATESAISSIRSSGCIDENLVESAALPTQSTIYRFPHSETALSFVTSDWYLDYYLIDRTTMIPITDSCSKK